MKKSEDIQLLAEHLRSSANVILATNKVDRVRYHIYISLLAISFAIEAFDTRLTTLENEVNK